MLPEWEVLREVLKQHSASAAGKFIDEVCWRTYWKGWLELRPRIWQDYLCARGRYLEDFAHDKGYLRAIEGRTGIDCMDAWTAELMTHGSLHNHARMWYASIWTHTLKLPWELGADWFLRHLLDGDAASNTLSWRWVAGLHTRGKCYLARADNIRCYTRNRFAVDTPLARTPRPLLADAPPAPKSLEALPQVLATRQLGLIVTDEDLSSQNGSLLQPIAPPSRLTSHGVPTVKSKLANKSPAFDTHRSPMPPQGQCSKQRTR